MFPKKPGCECVRGCDLRPRHCNERLYIKSHLASGLHASINKDRQDMRQVEKSPDCDFWPFILELFHSLSSHSISSCANPIKWLLSSDGNSWGLFLENQLFRLHSLKRAGSQLRLKAWYFYAPRTFENHKLRHLPMLNYVDFDKIHYHLKTPNLGCFRTSSKMS